MPRTFDNSFARDMEGFYVPWQGEPAPDPQTVIFNYALSEELGLDADIWGGPLGARYLSGAEAPIDAAPLAMIYAGHQFGGFSPQLGDGRALLLGEVIDPNGARHDLHLKGSGRTPFSRNGDGKAVLGPVLREYLMGEAMQALGVPTTRALAAVTTGQTVLRNGPERGAVLARVAASHLRVGTFQYFAARGQTEQVRQLADYAIQRHYPDLVGSPAPYLDLFRRVRDRQAHLVAQWMLLGFVHGVLNTDNVTISGETIDYGPCAFMDIYDDKTVFSSIDQGGRYAYGNQPAITQWNLARFAETLLDLINPVDSDDAIRQVTNELNQFPAIYQDHWLTGMRAKLGLVTQHPDDLALSEDLLSVMDGQQVDYTSLFRALADDLRGDDGAVRALFTDPAACSEWLARYRARSGAEAEPADVRAAAMDRVNPVYIPRNHMVQAALDAAGQGDLGPFETLLSLLQSPFDPKLGFDAYAQPAPDSFGRYRTFCGT